MAQEQIDWGKAWEVFWDRYKREAPNMHEIQNRAVLILEELWRQISPMTGWEETITISLDKDGHMVSTMTGCMLLGAIGLAGAQYAMEESKKVLDKELKHSSNKLENKLRTIEKRVERLEQWWSIEQKPPGEQ
jgi:tRNA(Phe) wybutosine-synthesizing methylase Tyw3